MRQDRRSAVLTACVLGIVMGGAAPAPAQQDIQAVRSESGWLTQVSAFKDLQFRPLPAAPARIELKEGGLPNRIGRANILPCLRDSSMVVRPPTQAMPDLNYYGGPVLGRVKVVVIYWGPRVAYKSRLPGFYSTIVQSPYFDWIKEYDTPNADIGRGNYSFDITDYWPPRKQNITDGDIQAELARLINSKALTPDAQTLYMVYFPPRLRIALEGQYSCQKFCAYHSSFLAGGAEVNYGVIPDQGGDCAGGCGPDPSQFNNETSVSSHELIEAVTDPAVGLASDAPSPEAPLAWYDPVNGEIGDICVAIQGTVSGYVVQREWSNRRGLCVDAADDPGSPFPGGQQSLLRHKGVWTGPDRF